MEKTLASKEEKDKGPNSLQYRIHLLRLQGQSVGEARYPLVTFTLTGSVS